jgi:hypothetical protein
MMAKTKRKVGRPATGAGLSLNVRCDRQLLARLDKWRNSLREPFTRPQAMRWLTLVGLEQVERSNKREVA